MDQPNAFDQFDEAQAPQESSKPPVNVFDQFDEPEVAPKAISQQVSASSVESPAVNVFDQFDEQPEPSRPENNIPEIAKAPLEFMSGVNRAALETLDFLSTDQVNAILELGGSEKRVPTFAGSELGQQASAGNFMDDGLAKDVVGTAGEVAGMAAGTGAIVRNAAEKLPSMVSKAESTGRGLLRDMATTTAKQDVKMGTLAGAGSELGGEAGEAIAGEEGRQVGEMVGALATPLAPAGVKAAMHSTKVNTALKEAAPTIGKLKDSARVIYKEIDGIGAKVKPEPLKTLANSIVESTKKEGFHPKIHPKMSAALDEITKSAEGELTISEVDTLRKIARAAARSLDPDESRLGSIAVDQIDDFMNTLPRQALVGGDGQYVGFKLRKARSYWGRAKRSELIDDAIERAKNQASGFENGLRSQFRSILNSKKKMAGFSPEEKNAIETIVRGGKLENTAKALGKFGFTEGQSSSMLMTTLGVAGGATAGGAVGALAVPALGTLARNSAQRLTRLNVKLANATVRAGKNGRAITDAYLRNVPAKERNTEELAGLLLDGVTGLRGLRLSKNKITADAAYMASTIKALEVAGAKPPVDSFENQPANKRNTHGGE